MGIFADVLAAETQVPAAAPRVGLDRSVGQAILAQIAAVDPTIGTAFTAVDEVQTIPAAESDAGTYTIKITLYNGTTFTTAAIAFDAVAATIEAALDTASPATVPNGDISVSGGPLYTDDVILTFDGTSVDELNHAISVVVSSLTLSAAPVTAPVVVETTQGQPSRTALQALKQMGVFTGTLPAQGDTPSDWVKNRLKKAPRTETIRALALIAAQQESNDAIYTTLATLYGF